MNFIVQTNFEIYVSNQSFKARRIHMEPDNGLKKKPTLVFLHEGLGCIDQWGKFPSQLCKASGCSGFLYERTGYGKNGLCSGRWEIDYLTHETTLLNDILDGCDIQMPVFIGHSDGGTLALLHAAAYPGRAMGIITEAAHIFIENETIDGINKAAELYRNGNLKQKLYNYHEENTDAVFWRWANRWLDPDFRNWNIESSLHRIICPALVIQGRNDEYATLAQVNGIENQVTGEVTRLVIDGCKHIPHIQARSQVIQQMALFIKGLIVT